jgi:hypothetical protein
MGEQYLSDTPGLHRKEVTQNVVTLAAADSIYPLFKAEEDVEIKAVSLTQYKGQLGSDAPNYVVCQILNTKADGTGTDVIAQKALSPAGTDITALVPAGLTVNPTYARVKKGEVVSYKALSVGLGAQDMGEKKIDIDFIFRQRAS